MARSPQSSPGEGGRGRPKSASAPARRPQVNKHQQRTAATKGKLLKAAMRIFSRDGFEASRIDDIAVMAGHTRGAFYAHFQSKEDLFFALLEEELNASVANLRIVLEKLTDERQRVAAIRKYYLSRASDRNWSILILEFKLYALRHSKMRAKLAESHRRIRTKIKQEVAANLWPDACASTPLDQEEARLTLEAVRHGLALERSYDPTSLSEAQMTKLLGKIFDVLMTPIDE